ncbi:MAG: response regulator [Pseudomonadales bacterium]|nr:response regulator [Pseudomonadales bacterium]
MSTQTQNPEQLRILLAEDNPDWVDTITAYAKESGAVVVAIATTFSEALEEIKHVKDKHIDLVILGGSLDKQLKHTNSDLLLLILALNEVDATIPTIALSGNDRGTERATINVGKTLTFAQDFTSALNQIMLGTSTTEN